MHCLCATMTFHCQEIKGSVTILAKFKAKITVKISNKQTKHYYLINTLIIIGNCAFETGATHILWNFLILQVELMCVD